MNCHCIVISSSYCKYFYNEIMNLDSPVTILLRILYHFMLMSECTLKSFESFFIIYYEAMDPKVYLASCVVSTKRIML
jgi:hypothetical protein